MRRHLGSLLPFVLLVAGCGGSSSNTDDGQPLTGDALAAACESTCAHMVSCGWATDAPMCQAECATGSSLFRGSGYAAWMSCIAGGDCAAGQPGEACYISAATDADARPVHDDYVSQCQAVATTCPAVTLPSGVCDLEEIILFSDPYMNGTVLPCFQQSCDQIAACLETTVLDAF